MTLNPDLDLDCPECNAGRTVIYIEHNLWRCKHCGSRMTEEEMRDSLPGLWFDSAYDDDTAQLALGADSSEVSGTRLDGVVPGERRRRSYLTPFLDSVRRVLWAWRR